MLEFYFEGADPDGKKLSGIVKAESEFDAREKLKKRRFAIFSIVPRDQASKKVNEKGRELETFEFSGVDFEGNPVNGRINATDEGAAYKSLFVEYDFEIDYLAKTDLPAEEKAKKQKEGISKELREWLKKELEHSEYYKKKQAEREVRRQRETVTLDKDQTRELELIQNQIVQVVTKLNGLLTENTEFLDKNKKREIEDHLNLLSRLRNSNALDHLKSLTENVLKKLTDDTIFLQNLKDEKQLEALDAIKSQFKDVAQEFDDQLKKELSQVSISIDLESVKPEVIKEKIVEVQIPQQIGGVFYYTFLFLFFLSVCFWISNFAQYFLFTDPEVVTRVFFYFNSSRLWEVTLLSAIICLGFAPMMFSRNTYTFKERLFYFVGMISLTFLVFFQFHSIFTWTA